MWVVSTAARPLDRFNNIIAVAPDGGEMPTKGELVSDAFWAHMTAVSESQQYLQILTIVRGFEQVVLAMGDLAHVGASERRTRQQIAQIPEQTAERVAQKVLPRFEHVEHRVDEHAELRADDALLDKLSPSDPRRRLPRDEVRALRKSAEERERESEARQGSLLSTGVVTATPLPPRAGLPQSRSSKLPAVPSSSRASPGPGAIVPAPEQQNE
eukprot:7376249-Prymnesium_polylepis.1